MNSIYSNRLVCAFVAAMLAIAAFEFLPEARAFSIVDPITNSQMQTMFGTNAAPRAIPRRASIILMVADGLGYGDLSCYGQTKFQTPNLDKLAAEGIRFTNYCGASNSVSSQFALMIGDSPSSYFELPFSNGHIFNAPGFAAPNGNTIAQLLKNSGYHTGLVGEWNLGDENSASAPWKEGFDEFAGYLNPADAENFYADYMWRLIPNFSYDESYNDKINGHWKEWNKADGPSAPGRETIYANTEGKNQYIPDLYTKAALNFVKNNLPDQFNHYQPFFLLVNYPVPKAGMPVPTDAPFSAEAWPQAEKNQAALISRLDGYVGQLAEQLQKLGMTSNAVIFFTSGSVAKKSGGVDPQFFHSNISTNDLRVPMIVHWPGRIPARQVSGFKWSPPDFLPTAAEIGFANSPTNLDGISVLPALFGGTQTNLPAKN